MIVGYARVSSNSQNIDRQIKKLKEYGCENVFVDKSSGKDLERKQYKKMKNFVRKGDTVVFAELDRLGRNKKDIDREWNDLINKGVDIVVLDMPILDTTKHQDELGELILKITREILSYIAEKERLNILERQKQGIEIAKREGKFKGRPLKYHSKAKGKNKLIYDTIINELRNGTSVMSIHEKTGASRNTIYKIKKEKNL